MEKLINDNPLVIPMGKAARIGNFKLWRGKYVLGKGKEKAEIECVHVSNLDGSWMVRIPATSMMFSTIVNGYATTDDKLREQFLGMIFTNMYNIGTVPSVALHDAFYFLTEMMTYPYMLLPEKEMEKRMKVHLMESGMEKSKVKEHIAKMMEYRHGLYELIERKKKDFIDEYERQQADMRRKEPEALKMMEQDAVAEDMMNELEKN